MKSKLAQIISKINKVNYSQMKAAYFVLMLAVWVLTRAPSDGGGTSI